MGQPNVLLILTDQQRADTLACYGNNRIETPHLNALAAESFVFEHAYVSQPVCSPARSTLFTGLYPHATGVTACNIPLPGDVPTIAELMPESYECAYMGKWHLGNEIFAQHGFTNWIGTEDSYRHSYDDTTLLEEMSPYHHFLLDMGYRPDSERLGKPVFSRHFAAGLDEPHTKAAFLADQAVSYLAQRDDTPFFLCVSYLEPHPPHRGPFDDHYDPWSLPTDPSFMQRPGADASLVNRVMAAYYMESEEYGFDLRSEEGWRQVRARYWGNVTLVDRSVGRILEALEANGLADDTIVVFTSDHGEMVGDHGLLGKTVLYEPSVRVPWTIRVPSLGRSQRLLPGNISQIDLVPTLLDLAGVERPDHLQGSSRRSVLEGEADLADNPVVIEWHNRDGHPLPGEAEVNRALSAPWRTLISPERWKLNLCPYDRTELYDLNTDPYELTNLHGQPAHAARESALRETIAQWQADYGDPVSIE